MAAFLAKLRPNVLILAVLATLSATGALWLVMHYLGAANVLHGLNDNPEMGILLGAVIGGTVGILIGSLLTLAGQVAIDPPPPAYPAKELPDLVRVIQEPNAPKHE